MATEFDGNTMRHRGTTAAHRLRAGRRALRLEQLEPRQMLSGNVAANTVSSAWFADYAAGQPAHAASPSISANALGTTGVTGPVAGTTCDWIVQFNTLAVGQVAAPATVAALLPQGGVQFQVIEGLGAVGEVLVRSYGATAEQARAALQADSHIAWCELDALRQIAAVPNDRFYSQQWAATNTNATAAWNLTTGSRSVVVAVIDSGVDYTHPDLAANIWTNPNAGRDGFAGDLHGYNFVANNGNPMDDNGHGTHVAGIIGASGNNAAGIAGVNWNVTIMPLKFLDANGGGYTSDAIRAINYATMERTQYGVNVRVINASWSSNAVDPALNAAIQAAGNAGILVVAAAGNSATNNDLAPQYPASSALANVVSVAASDASDQLAGFSNYGASSVSLAAPGVRIYSTLPGGAYGFLSGTSMATPEVAGVAALAWAANPNATVAQVRSALLQGVDKLPALAGKVASGGRLNAFNTLKLVMTPSPAPAPKPAPTPTTVTPPSVAALVVGAATVQSGDAVSLIAQGVTATGGTITSVYFYLDSIANGQWNAGDTLVGSTTSVSGGRATATWNTGSLATGTYRLFARALDSSGRWSAAVTTTLTIAAKPSAGTSVSTALPVNIGSTAQGSIAKSSVANYFQVQLVAGQQYSFQTTLGTLADSVLTLVGSDGRTVIAQNDDMAGGNRASKISWQATGSGRYYLVVSSYPGAPLGSFSLVTSQVSSSQSSPRLQGRSVAIPSATLRSAAAARSTEQGAGSQHQRTLQPAAVDTLFYAVGR